MANARALLRPRYYGCSTATWPTASRTPSRSRRACDVSLNGESEIHGEVAGWDVEMADNSEVHGDVTAKTFVVRGSNVKHGKIKQDYFEPLEIKQKNMLPVYVPSSADDLGNLDVGAGTVQTLTGPASYFVDDVMVDGELQIDNTAGPVTLYVRGTMDVGATGNLTFVSADPDYFALYGVGEGLLRLAGQGTFYGVIYAPDRTVELAGAGFYIGAFVGRDVVVGEQATVQFAEQLGENQLQQERLEQFEDAQEDIDEAADDVAQAWLEVAQKTQEAMEAEASAVAKAEADAAKAAAKAEAKAAKKPEKADEAWAKADEKIARAWTKADERTAKAWTKVAELTADAEEAELELRAAEEALIVLMSQPVHS